MEKTEQWDKQGVQNPDNTKYLLINFLRQKKSCTVDASTRINGLPEFEVQFKEVCERVDRTFFEETEDPDEEEERSWILGDFKILREIDSGGMATVYEAQQISLKRNVALKLLPSYLRFSDEAIRKFRREAEAGGRQHHPGIVSVYAVGEHEGMHYIAQELVGNGNTLADWLIELRKKKTLPLGYSRHAAELIAGLADALAHAHASGVIHRDVKPSNILFTEEGQPKVTDFGLAKVEDALALSRTGEFAGTPFYMSPEQAMGRKNGTDQRTDIYSLGVTLYELLTLKRPFEGDTTQEVLKKIVQHEPMDARKVNPRVPRDLSVICQKAMEKDPNHRYGTMAKFAEDLRRFLQGEVIMARPAGPGTRILKRIKRNPVVSAAVGTALLAVIFTVVVVPWIVVQKEKVRAAAFQAEAEKTRKVNDFMKWIFSMLDSREYGRKVELADVLDRAVGEMGKLFPDWPEVDASMRQTIGATYFDLGLYEDALVQFEAANDIRRRILGERHPDTLTVTIDMAEDLLKMGRYDEAEDLFQKVLDIRRQALGEDHPDTLGAMSNLATARSLKGNGKGSKSIYHMIIEKGPSQLGEEHPLLSAAMNNLAGILFKEMEFEQAESYYREAFETRNRILGKEHPDTLKSMIGLANTLVYLDKCSEAEKLLREVNETQERILGEDHPDTLNGKNSLACVLWKQGRYEEAEKLLASVLKTQCRLMGEEYPDAIRTRDNLAGVLCAQRRLNEAELKLRKVLELRRRTLGDENLDTLLTCTQFSELLTEMDKALEAESLLSEALDSTRRKLPPEHPRRTYFHKVYGKCLTRLERYAAAESQLLEAYNGLQSKTDGNPLSLRGALELFVELYDAWDKPKKSAEYRELLSSFMNTVSGK